MTQSTKDTIAQNPLSAVEAIKVESRYLRGSIIESLAEQSTGALAESDTQLIKFHGSYQYDDRDVREERRQQKLEPDYMFMIRVRVPAGVCTPAQWMAIDKLAGKYGDGTLRLTTRQAFQLHGVLKGNLRHTLKGINDSLLTTIAACGDVTRNVVCNPNPLLSSVHSEVHSWALRLSRHLEPRTTAYHELWIEGENIGPAEDFSEPIYGRTYLPRKFKIGIAVPPTNEVDVFAQDLGLIAIVEGGCLVGFNVAVGGGMGMTTGDTNTYPRLADLIGFCTPEHVIQVAEAVVTAYRDSGDRTNRRHARLKYVIDSLGLDWFREELARRLGRPLGKPRDYVFEHSGDRMGWVEGEDGAWHLTLFVENGRIQDSETQRFRSGLRAIAEVHTGDFRLTPNQNVIVASVPANQKKQIDQIATQFGMIASRRLSPLRMASMACVALPTCGLAMAESERYLPSFLDKLEAIVAAHGIPDVDLTVRMTGCPNGCARPYLAEIGLVGRAVGRYNLYLGGDKRGQRMNRLYKENIDETAILKELDVVIGEYAQGRSQGESFGDFVVRTGRVTPATRGADFHVLVPHVLGV